MVKAELHRVLEKIVGDLGASVTFSVDYAPAHAGADFATNAALSAAKALGKNPQEVAKEISEALVKENVPFVEMVSVAGPGFVNISLTPQFFSDTVARALADAEEWGRNASREGDRVMVEYTSPNLFKPLHAGNLMSNIIGESIARLVEAVGAKVSRVNYASDIGLTVAKGVWGLKSGGFSPDDIHELGRAYLVGGKAYEEDEKAKVEIDAINRALYAGNDEELNQLRQRGIKTSLADLMETCRILGTKKFDIEIFESESGPVGRDIVLSHVDDGIFEESDGAVVFKGERFGLHTRVFINSAGLPTYEAKDVGLAKLKADKYPFDQSITVTALEQKEYFKVVIRAIESIFPNLQGKVQHIAYGFLTLPTGKKMASRKGEVVTGEALIKEMTEKAREREQSGVEHEHAKEVGADVSQKIAVAAIKYTVLKQGTNKNVMFDPEKSLSLEGDSGPYLQYAQVRASSILRKAEVENIEANASGERGEVTLVERLLIRFPEIVEHSAQEYEPHYVAQYLTELASAFNSWYAQGKVLDGTDKAPYKLALVDAVGTTLKNGLYLLGIEAPQQM